MLVCSLLFLSWGMGMGMELAILVRPSASEGGLRDSLAGGRAGLEFRFAFQARPAHRGLLRLSGLLSGLVGKMSLG